MKVFIAKRLRISEDEAFGDEALCDVYVGATRKAAIKAVVDGCMRDWWHDLCQNDDERSIDASAEEIFNEYIEFHDTYSDGERVAIEEEEIVE